MPFPSATSTIVGKSNVIVISDVDVPVVAEIFSGALGRNLLAVDASTLSEISVSFWLETI